MTTNHHTPHPFAGAVASAEFNSRLGELDQAITEGMAAGLVGTSTTLDGAANAGQKVLPVTSTVDFLVGDAIWVGPSGSGIQEGATIASVSAGVSLTTVANLINTHAIGEPVSRSPAEIVDARGVATTLGLRLDAMEAASAAVGARVVERASALRSWLDAADSTHPALIAHRGYSRSVPENTREAFRVALGSAAKGVETDVQWSIDRQPILLHDTTLSRTTGSAGGPLNYSMPELRRMDAGSWYNAAFADEKILTLREYLAEFGQQLATIYEAKVQLDASWASAASTLADYIADFNLERFAIVAAFSNDIASGDAWTVHGIPLMRHTGGGGGTGTVGGATPASLYSSGFRYIGVDYTDPDLAADVAAWQAAGLKVFAYTVATRRDRNLCQAAGITGIITDDPIYLDTRVNFVIPVGTNIPFNQTVIPTGVIPFVRSGTAGVIETPGGQLVVGHAGQRIGWPVNEATFLDHCLVLGSLGWGAAGLGKLEADLYYDAAGGSDRWGGLFVSSDDRGYLAGATAMTTTGYEALLRANGTLQLYRVANGVSTSIGSAAGAALTVTDVRKITLEVTATNVIATGNSVTVNVADTTYRALTACGLARNNMGCTFDLVLRSS